MNDLQVIAVCQSGLTPLIAGHNTTIQFHGDAALA